MNPSAHDVGQLLRARNGAAQVSLLSLLSEIQERYHYLPHNALVLLSETLDLPLTQIYSVATFYNAFSLKPRGVHLVRVCMGTACHVRGAPRMLDETLGLLGVEPGQTSKDGLLTVECVNCLGACALGPVVVLDGEYHHHMTPAKLRKLVASVREAEEGAPAHAEAAVHC